MSYLSGEIEVKLWKTDDTQEFVAIPGRDFGLEEGGDWYRDRDDGTWNAGFLFISFQDGYDVIVNFAMVGNQVTHYSARIRISDPDLLKDEEIRSVTISEDNLSLDSFYAPDVDVGDYDD